MTNDDPFLGVYMPSLSELLNQSPVDSLLLFIVTFALLIGAAYGGKHLFKRRYSEEEKVEEDEAKLILGALLSLLGLLIGFVLTVAISGYNDRQRTEEQEAITIGVAYQHTQLLEDPIKAAAESLLEQYLEARIAFFESGVGAANTYWRHASVELQAQLWGLAVTETQQVPNAINALVLKAYSELYLSQQHTLSSWRHQIPNAAWLLLLFFAVSANALIGYNIRGLKGDNWLLFILPSLTTLALFMVAEIDIPGEGLIHVMPDDLLDLKQFLLRSLIHN